MTGPKRIRKRVDAETWCFEFDGTNHAEIISWADGNCYLAEGRLYVMTDREDVVADAGDHIIRGLVGEYYPCTPASYEAGWEEL